LKTVNDTQHQLAWRVGGPQGSGVDSAAGIFSRACALGGLNVLGRREYYSNIMGRHSYYDVRVSDLEITCHRDRVDLLTTFEAESLARHFNSVIEGGALVYAAKDEDTPLDKITYLDPRAARDLATLLAEQGLPASTAGTVEYARGHGVNTFRIDFDEVVEVLAERLGAPRAIAARTLNTLAVAVSTALVGYEVEYVHEALAKTWPGRQKIVDMNIAAVSLAYEIVQDSLDTSEFHMELHATGIREPRIFLNGSQSVALGKMAGGLAFQSYYPISPATDESVYLEGHQNFATSDGEPAAVVVVQTEDEISAFGMAAAASLTGARSSTATSGPGLALMVEGMGWAGINEAPIVVTLYMRGGPSTGLPTRSEQGDLNLALYGGSGDFPRIVMASSDLTESFYDAAQAFNYADRYQTPVIHLIDKALSSQTQTVPPFDTDLIQVERGAIADPARDNPEGGAFPRFRVTESGVSPRPFLGTEGATHWTTGGEHTEVGRVTEDPVIREQQMEKRMRKLDLAAREIPLGEKLQVYGNPEAAFTLMSWGSNKGGILEAMDMLKGDGVQARLLQVRIMSPFPTEEMSELIASAAPLVAVESSFSAQLAQALRQHTGRACEHLVVKYNGRPMSARELYGAFKEILEGKAEQRIVLRNPYE
jgi:2-oxoglutarate ferredoxin oxidoreductase subunit alpha